MNVLSWSIFNSKNSFCSRLCFVTLHFFMCKCQCINWVHAHISTFEKTVLGVRYIFWLPFIYHRHNAALPGAGHRHQGNRGGFRWRQVGRLDGGAEAEAKRTVHSTMGIVGRSSTSIGELTVQLQCSASCIHWNMISMILSCSKIYIEVSPLTKRVTLRFVFSIDGSIQRVKRTVLYLQNHSRAHHL